MQLDKIKKEFSFLLKKYRNHLNTENVESLIQIDSATALAYEGYMVRFGRHKLIYIDEDGRTLFISIEHELSNVIIYARAQKEDEPAIIGRIEKALNYLGVSYKIE